MRILLLIFITLFSSVVPLQAQFAKEAQNAVDDPTTWSYAIKRINRDQIEVHFKVTMQKGWHLFSLNPGDSMLIPPTFTFEPNSGYSLVGGIKEWGTIIEATLEGFDSKIRYYEGYALFVQTITLKEPLVKINGSHLYQVCNDKMCLPPTSLPFELTVQKLK